MRKAYAMRNGKKLLYDLSGNASEDFRYVEACGWLAGGRKIWLALLMTSAETGGVSRYVTALYKDAD